MNRHDNRQPDQLRDISFEPGVAPHASGSVLCSFGDTKVICAATIEEAVPRWMKYQGVKGGWLTAEYSMLPYSTLDRKTRDSTKGKVDGRSMEIQRLIGRSLRATLDLSKLGSRTIWIDCDVIQADGGTRTASITGASVALGIALNSLLEEGKIKTNPVSKMVAAVSCGVHLDTPLLDLNYLEDKDASVDCNIVMTENLDFVELQASGEEAVFSDSELANMLGLARKGIKEIVTLQKEAIAKGSKSVSVDLPDFSATGGKLEF